MVVFRFANTIRRCIFVAIMRQNMSKFQHQIVCSIKFEITIFSHPLVYIVVVGVDEIPWGHGRWHLGHASTQMRSISELHKTSAHSHFQIWITIWNFDIMKNTKVLSFNCHLSIFDQTACSEVIRDVQLWGQKHPTTKTKATTKQPQLQTFVFHVYQPPHLCSFVI